MPPLENLRRVADQRILNGASGTSRRSLLRHNRFSHGPFTPLESSGGHRSAQESIHDVEIFNARRARRRRVVLEPAQEPNGKRAYLQFGRTGVEGESRWSKPHCHQFRAVRGHRRRSRVALSTNRGVSRDRSHHARVSRQRDCARQRDLGNVRHCKPVGSNTSTRF